MATYRDRPPSFSYGGGGSGRGSIAELIYASGQDRANATMQQGDILANTIAGVGQDIGAGIQANQQAKALKARTEAFNNLFAGDQPPDPNSILKVLGPKDGMEVIKGLNALHPQASYKDRMEQFRDVARGVQAVPEQARPAAYDTAVKSLTANGVLKPGEAPETYDPNFLTQVASYGQAPKEKAIQTATVPGPNGPMLKSVTPEELAAGVPTYVAPKAEARLPAEEAYIKAKFGDNPTPQQMLQGRAQFASAGREPKAPRDLSAGDVEADAWASGMAFPSTQEATSAALESFKRRGLPVPRKLSVAMQKEVADTADTIATIADVEELYKKVKGVTGPVSYPLSELGVKIPGLASNPDFVAFNTMLRSMGNLEIKRITGAQMSEKEADRLLKGMATGSLKPGDFEAALGVMKRNATRSRDIKLYGKADPLGGSGAAGGAPVRVSSPAEARKLPKGTPIILPDGRTGTVP